MKLDFKVTGTAKVMARLKKLEKSAPEAVVIGLMALGEKIIASAVKRTPVDTGRLRQTAYVAPPEDSGYRNTVEIGFGTKYAVPVHEKTEVSHTTGESKFLQKAWLEVGQGQLWWIARQVEKFLLKGGKARRTKYPTRPPGGE